VLAHDRLLFLASERTTFLTGIAIRADCDAIGGVIGAGPATHNLVK
jgi:hypothetical protein